jgi:hypothetical protein
MMKVTINELKNTIKELIYEVTDANAVVLKLRDLAASSADDPRRYGSALLAFVRGLGGDEQVISAVKNALARRDAQAINVAIEGFISSRVRGRQQRKSSTRIQAVT